MSYIINNSRGQIVAVVADGTVNTSATDLTLVGRGLTDYGTYENENYVYLLENFANSSAPLQPVLGQLWYNSSSDVIAAYSSTNAWIPLASQAYVQAQKVSPAFSGVPTAPTAAAGTSTTQLATTAFVTSSPQFSGVPTAPTAASGTANTQIATTAFVTSGPAFAGIPTAPTAANATSNSQLATTEFVQNQKNSPELTGTPTATTADYGDSSTRIATTEFVQGEKFSPAFTGIPTAPTASVSTNTTQIATTQFVQQIALALPSMSQQSAGSVNITGGTITGITPLLVVSGGTGSNNPTGARNNLGLGSIATQNANAIAVSGGSIDNVNIAGGNISSLANPLAVSSGGTGAANAGAARTNLGLGTIAVQDFNLVNITGGNISGLTTPLAVESGGTGSNTLSGARAGLGLGTISTQNANAIAVSGGTLVGITQFNGANVTVTSGSISGIIPLAIADGGTGANTAAAARTNLGAAGSGVQIVAGSGLDGGGSLVGDVTLRIATNSNGYGTRYISTSTPSSGVGVTGDIWYQI